MLRLRLLNFPGLGFTHIFARISKHLSKNLIDLLLINITFLCLEAIFQLSDGFLKRQILCLFYLVVVLALELGQDFYLIRM